VVSWQSFMSLNLKLLDIDHPLTFEESKIRQIEAHALIYLSKLIVLPIRTTHVELFQVTASISFKRVMNRRYIGQDGCPPCGHDDVQGTVFLITISKSY